MLLPCEIMLLVKLQREESERERGGGGERKNAPKPTGVQDKEC